MLPAPLAFAAGLLLIPIAAAASPVDDLLSEAAQTCAGIDGGEMTAPDGAVTSVDLSGDGTSDTILDESRLTCSTAASAFCGSGGCGVHAIVGDKVTSWLATGWRTIDWNQDTILLIGLDGGDCGGIGAERCYEAAVWSDGRFLTVAPPEPDSSDSSGQAPSQ